MKEQKNQKMKIVQYILGILMLSAFLFFIVGEVLSPAENISENSTYHVFHGNWTAITADGTEEAFTIPGTCKAKKGEWATITTTLPQNQENTWLCIRSMQQDLKIYVDEALRKEYSTLDTQPFGKTSTMTFVFFPLYDSDAGKTLSIQFMSNSSYSGYVGDIFAGDRADISKHLYGMYTPSIIIAALLFLIGVFVACCCLFVRILYKREIEIFHLGNAVIIASTWLIVESKLRQFVLPNSTIAMLTGFLMIAVLPYPFLSYINTVQKCRYEKAYMTIGICTIVNYIVIITLQVLNIKDFFEIVTTSHIIILALIVIMGTTIVLDIFKGYINEYREVAIGFAAVMFAGICEIGLVYIIDAQINGIALCIGLVVLLISAGLKSIRDLLNIEREKQIAISASEAKAKFLANMSHEIRTPINTVIGMNEMILRENKDEAIEEYAYSIKSASQMLLSLINDVLDFSKIEAGKLQIIENDYSLRTMITDVIQGIETRAAQKNLELELRVDETLPSILKGDEIRIKQILNNLLSNALKYTEKGSITLSFEGIRNDNTFYLLLSVADTGIGIKQEDMEKLFDSFQRLELSKNRYIEGTGLGLTITKQLVHNMNGTIDVQSIYGMGSCFTVKLPQVIVNEEAMGSLNQKNMRHKPENSSPENYLYAPDASILIVDDTRMNLRVIEMLLKRSEIQMDFATGGNECLQKTREKKYDLILMDHMMPEPDGIQTLHLIRDDKDNPNRATEVIVLTANALAGMQEEYLAEGFADYLSKPIDADKLEQTIAKYLK